MVRRRRFLQQTALTGIGLIVAQRALATLAPAERSIVGLQLYCVRDEMKADPAGTLAALSRMGYRHVEHANYVGGKFYGYTPPAFKNLLTDLGMDMPSGHTVLRPEHWDSAKKDFTDEWKKTIEDAAFMGQRFVISPWMDQKVRTSYDALLLQLDAFNKSGALCAKLGMKFGYHNHDFEFSEKHQGRTLYDIILGETDSHLVMQQLDTGNLFNGGANALAIVQQYPSRFESIHVKDAISVKGGPDRYESTILGKGVADIRKILEIISQQKTNPHLIIEQEAYQGMKPIDCMQQNLQMMKDWGYV